MYSCLCVRIQGNDVLARRRGTRYYIDYGTTSLARSICRLLEESLQTWPCRQRLRKTNTVVELLFAMTPAVTLATAWMFSLSLACRRLQAHCASFVRHALSTHCRIVADVLSSRYSRLAQLTPCPMSGACGGAGGARCSSACASSTA